MKEIKIQFPDERYALAFASWLSNSGEQDFYDTQQMLVDDGEIDGIIGFHYHGEVDDDVVYDEIKEYDPDEDEDEPNMFMADWTIRTSLD